MNFKSKLALPNQSTNPDLAHIATKIKDFDSNFPFYLKCFLHPRVTPTVSHFLKVYKLCKVTIEKSVKLPIFRIEFEKTLMFSILDAFGYLMDFCYKKRVMAYGKTYWHNKMSRITIPVLFFFSKIWSPCLAPRNIFILFQFSVSYCPMPHDEVFTMRSNWACYHLFPWSPF